MKNTPSFSGNKKLILDKNFPGIVDVDSIDEKSIQAARDALARHKITEDGRMKSIKRLTERKEKVH